MEQALTLNGPILDTNLAKLKETKSSVIKEMRNKVNGEELRLVLERLKEIGIPVTGEFKDIIELKTYLRKNLVQTDYEKAEEIITKVDKEFDQMITALENGSTNAFTRIMTGDLSTSIAKSLGITLTGNALLLLAPTLGTKAIVGAGLGTYYLAKALINRKEIKKINTNNELNNIIFELEITKDGDKIIDTRFNEEIQKEIRDYLKKNKIYFEDTGYKSLKTAIYNLDYEKKLTLAQLLNAKIGKGIKIEERLKKVKKRLNVVASTVGTATAGLALGTSVATTINSINPALISAPINGTIIGEALGSFLSSLLDKPWLKKLTGLIGGVGTTILSCISDLAKGIFSAENILICGTLGLTGGIITSGMLNLISVLKQIKANNKNKKEIAEYNQLDNEKYQKENTKELETIKEEITKKSNPAAILIDIVIGSLRDNNIVLNGSPNNLQELTKLINELSKEDKKVAKRILENVDTALKSNKELVTKKLSQIATFISVFTLSGFSALSIYDIIKGGKILPELSKKLFPDNNIHTPVAGVYDSNTIIKKGNISKADRERYLETYQNILDKFKLKKPDNTIPGQSKAIEIDISEMQQVLETETANMSNQEIMDFYNTVKEIPPTSRNASVLQKTLLDKIKTIIDAYRNPAGKGMYDDLAKQAVSVDKYEAAQNYFDPHTGDPLTSGMNGQAIAYLEGKEMDINFLDNTLGKLIRIFDKDFSFALPKDESIIPLEEITKYLGKCSPDKIVALKLFIETNPNINKDYAGSIIYRINTIIENAQQLQARNDFINNATSAVGKASVVVAAASATRTSMKTRDNTGKYTK